MKKLISKNATKTYKVFLESYNDTLYMNMYSYDTLICGLKLSFDSNGNVTKKLFITDTINYSITTQKHLHKFINEFDFENKYILGQYPQQLAKQLFNLVERGFFRHAKNMSEFETYNYYASKRFLLKY